MNNKFENVIRQRICQRVPLNKFSAAGIHEFYVAGNSLNKLAPNDIDIFPIESLFTRDQASRLGNIVSETKNAITVKVNLDENLTHQNGAEQNEIHSFGKTITVQLCNYQHKDLITLVNSFDFSHIQIGAKISVGESIDQIYYTNEYSESKLCQSTEYTGSEYPLSSLIRAFKYAKRGDFSGNSHIFSVFKVLVDIVGRGFKDYQDFKNQLDAIDLGLVPENQSELSDSGLSDTGLDYSEEGNLVLNKLMNFLYLGKQGITKDPGLSFEYAKTLGGRFEEGEEAISSRSNLIYEYWNILNKNKELNEKEKLPELLHNKMIVYGMNNDYYANLYLRSIVSKVA
jgi:hypothetical protein